MIYKLRYDRFNYLLFEISPNEIEARLGDMFILDKSETWSEFWQPVNVEFEDGSAKENIAAVPDISLLLTNQIICNQKAYDALREALNPYGEWLPITVEGIPYWLLHVTKKTGVEYVDVKNSKRTLYVVDYNEIEKLTFKNELLESLLLFKTAYNDYKNIYCTDKFKNLIMEFGLKGLLFSTELGDADNYK